jgi:D-methionine transport system ATP-binding protein
MSVVESVCRHVASLDNGTVVEQGEVGEVFSNPKTEAARKLVFPEGETDPVIARDSEEVFIRVVFNGAKATATPLIAQLAIDKGIAANISYASTRSIGDGSYGSMLLGITGGEENVKTAIDYLQQMPGVIAREVPVNV